MSFHTSHSLKNIEHVSGGNGHRLKAIDHVSGTNEPASGGTDNVSIWGGQASVATCHLSWGTCHASGGTPVVSGGKQHVIEDIPLRLSSTPQMLGGGYVQGVGHVSEDTHAFSGSANL